jgi:tetratricopeptide (TPR) repeat protein
VDKEKVLANGTVSQKFADQIVPEIQWELNQNYVLKNHMMVLDLLANNDWERPVYYAITVSSDNYLNLSNYFQVQGLSYRIVPVKTESYYPNTGGIDTDIVFDKIINVFRWGGIENQDVYLDENVYRMLSNYRNNFGRLAEALISEGKTDSAKVVLEKCLHLMPDETMPFDVFTLSIAESYFRLNEPEKALEVINKLKDNTLDELNYLVSLEKKFDNALSYEKRLNLHVLNELIRILRENGRDDLRIELESKFQDYIVALDFAAY